MSSASSPAQASQQTPENGFVSPNSKIAKMLADIDKQYDEEPEAASPTKGQSSTLAAAREPTRTISPQASSEPFLPKTNAEGPFQQTSDSELDKSDDDVRRPQGRAAKRMYARGSSANGVEEPSSNAESPPAANQDEDLYSSTPQKHVNPNEHLSETHSGRSGGDDLFVSPAKSIATQDDDDDDDLPSNLMAGSKFKALVAQKKAERLAREAEEKQRKAELSSAHPSSDLPEGDVEGSQDVPADPEVERIMSDASRPARKASKKALLEMERETQRLAREQALAHQMKTKKKFTTSDFLAKFNLPRQADGRPKEPEHEQASGKDTASSSAPNSDGIEESGHHPVSTPPSSPPTPLDRQKALVNKGALSKLVPVRQDSIASVAEMDSDEELPDLANIIAMTQQRKAIQASLDLPPIEKDQPDSEGLKLARLGKKPVQALIDLDDNDDDLEIIAKMPPHLRAFDRATGMKRGGKPAESRALHNLKHLSNVSHINDGLSKKKGTRPSINPNVLEAQLRKKAKDQARQQQLDRIEELKAKGIFVQSVEEREKEAEVYENMLDKARVDAVALRKAEKQAAKGVDEGAMDASDDEEEDEDYQDSGSDEGEENEQIRQQDENAMVDTAAEESDDEDQEEEEEEEEELYEEEQGSQGEDNEGLPVKAENDNLDETQPVADAEMRSLITDAGTSSSAIGDEPAIRPRKPRKVRVIEDDEHEEGGDNSPPSETDADAVMANVAQEDEDPFAAFNFGAATTGDLLLSPTQAFNATMRTPTQLTQEDSMEIFNRIAAPPSASSLPPTIPDNVEQSQAEIEIDGFTGSQVPESQRINLDWESQAPQTPVHAGLRRDNSALIETPGWVPTQDNGLASPWPLGPTLRREETSESLAEYETQSTVKLRVSESPAPSQTAPKRGRLVRKQVAIADESSDDEAIAQVKPAQRDAFREMARKRREALTAAERLDAEKEMRGMMDEQAEESEDEYAGLGGDDYVAPETEQDREMIDSSHVEVDERALAAHYAERERAREEEETSRLYKDLTTGVLRRKMGANAFDLEEDEDELAARRRQMRQREEARKRKALLKDENIANLADGKQSKGKDAFLKAIADDDGDEDMINLSDNDADQSVPATQDDSQLSQTQTGALRETNGNKRRLAEDETTGADRAPAKQRRTQFSAFKRPTSLLEVQESVSFLLEDQNAHVLFGPTALEHQSGSDSEHEDEQGQEPAEPILEDEDEDAVAEEARRQNDGGYAPDQPLKNTAPPPPPPQPARLPASERRTPASVVDRLSLKRISSASSSSDSAHSRTAWAAGPSTGGFKVPSLLRRATTSSAAAAASGDGNDRGVTTSLSRENSSGAGGSGGGVKMGGSKKSSLAYQARAEERRAIVEASARRREENTRKIAQMRRSASANGLLGRGFGGSFE